MQSLKGKIARPTVSPKLAGGGVERVDNVIAITACHDVGEKSGNGFVAVEMLGGVPFGADAERVIHRKTRHLLLHRQL